MVYALGGVFKHAILPRVAHGLVDESRTHMYVGAMTSTRAANAHPGCGYQQA